MTFEEKIEWFKSWICKGTVDSVVINLQLSEENEGVLVMETLKEVGFDIFITKSLLLDNFDQEKVEELIDAHMAVEEAKEIMRKELERLNSEVHDIAGHMNLNTLYEKAFDEWFEANQEQYDQILQQKIEDLYTQDQE